MTQDEIIEMAMQAEFVSRARSTDEESELFVCVDKDIVRFAKLVAAKEREIYDHDTRVLMDALWKACGDDEEVVNATIESQGTLIRVEQS